MAAPFYVQCVQQSWTTLARFIGVTCGRGMRDAQQTGKKIFNCSIA